MTWLVLFVGSATAQAQNVAALEELGKRVFFQNISVPPRQSCSTCHVPGNGWTGGVAGFNRTFVAVPGATPHTIGGRKPPSVSYVTASPAFGNNPGRVNPCLGGASVTPLDCKGGVFWDGRATGNVIGVEVFANTSPQLEAAYTGFLGPLADQALGPFPNDLEQNVPDGNDGGFPGAEAVCRAVESSMYVPLFAQAWGMAIDCEPSGVAISFKRIAVAISAWEHSTEVNSFSSRRDQALAADADHAFPLSQLSAQENLGHELFFGRARCFVCHNSAGAGAAGNEVDQTYTDDVYRNLGLPPNLEIANFDSNNPDAVLFDTTQDVDHRGGAKTPGLRNVDKRRGKGFTKAYMHNGYLKSLEDVVHFYNTASALPICPNTVTTAAAARANNCWPAAEFPNNTSRGGANVGNLGLSAAEEAAVVAFLKTLSDTETVTQPLPYIP